MKAVPPPTVLQLELTKKCNNRCIMCHKGQFGESHVVKTDISDVVLGQVRPVFPYLRCAILFGDGEPMLYRGFWDVVKDIRQASPEVAIEFINNGSLMTRKNVERVLQFGISHIGLSMGGAETATHNYIRRLSDFNKVVANYSALREAKKSLGVKEPYIHGLLVAMKSNYVEIPKFVGLCAWLGFIGAEIQQLFVTHPSVENERVESSEIEQYFAAAKKIAEKTGISFRHYPLESGANYNVMSVDGKLINEKDRYFRSRWEAVADSGYCACEEPWNTVYVLHDGSVVPCCHWWGSKRDRHFNVCGWLNENTSLLDVWNGHVFELIRARIKSIKYLSQCRGCGLAGGVKQQFRCAATDHTNPNEE